MKFIYIMFALMLFCSLAQSEHLFIENNNSNNYNYFSKIGNTEIRVGKTLELLTYEGSAITNHIIYKPIDGGDVSFVNEGTESDFHYYQRSNIRDSRKASEKLLVKNFFRGADLRLQITGEQFRYDIIVNPNTDLSNIKFEISGSDALEVKNGLLNIKTKNGIITNHNIIAFQDFNNTTLDVSCQYKLDGNILSFEVQQYNRSSELVIDPTIFFSMFGGSQDDKIVKTIINGDELIVLGTTKSGDYSSHDYNIPDGEDILEQDIFISRYSIKYSDRKHLSTTFLGGTNFDEITDAAISRDGSKLYIVGNTNSNDFPYLGTQHASVRGDLDGFFTKFDIETMAMEFSSIYGGSAKDSLTGIAVNQQGDFYIIGTTSSTNISLKSAAQTFVAGGTDMCFAKFWSDGVNPYFSTYIGGNEDDRANAIALSDDSYHIYIAGSTRSSNFEIIPKWDYYGKIFDRKHNGGKDGLLLVYKDGQPKFSYSCFFGGDGDDEIMDIAYYNDKLYFVGNTKSELTGILPKSDDTVFPISPTSFQTTNKGNTDGFIAVCEHLLNVLTYSSFIGGSKYDAITNIYVSTVTDGNPNIIGVTESNDFPIQSGGSSSYHANKDVVVSGFTTGFGGLSYTRFVGTSKNDYPSDIVFDNINTYILSGYSQSDDFHLDKEASTQHHGGYDGFIHKFTTESLLLETPGDKDSYCSQNSITIKWNSQDIIQKSYKLEYTDNNIDYKDLTDILDKNSFVWSLDSAEVFQSDLYKIRVSSLSGLVSENVGNFSIIDSPGNGILSTESALENLCIGDTVKIFCNAPYKNLTYLWFVNNKQLVNNNDTLIYPITASINLEIYCKLSNGCSPDTKTNSLKVTVAKPSAINSQIADTTIIENRTLLLEADVNEATERVDWYKDDELIAGNSNSLNFESIRLQDSGSYHFKAFGKCNAVTSEKFYIDVDPDVSVSEENLYELFSKFEIADNGTEKPYLNIQSNNLVFDCVLFDNIGNRLEYLTVNSQNLSYNFNTKDHPAGIYWITVYIDNASYSRKIVLVK